MMQMANCNITPVSAFQSTNLNSKITTFNRLADRIVRSLGAPLVQIELHQDQIFENISIACELFTKFAGYTSEFLVFDSDLYEANKGLRLDYLFTLANPTLTLEQKVDGEIQSPEAASYINEPKTMFISTSAIAAENFDYIPSLSAIFEEGVFANQIFDESTYVAILTSFASTPQISANSISSIFVESFINQPTLQGSSVDREESNKTNNMFDYDILDYRKVIAVSEFEEGSSFARRC
jgi:hypothetical protein